MLNDFADRVLTLTIQQASEQNGAEAGVSPADDDGLQPDGNVVGVLNSSSEEGQSVILEDHVGRDHHGID